MQMCCYKFFIALPLVICAACGSKGASHSETDEADADSAAINEEIIIDKALERLPDTVYASVGAVNYSVSVIDGGIDPVLSSLEDLYAHTPGAFTFRKGIQRRADFGGRIEGDPLYIKVVWKFETVFKGTWGGGSGWTGQPLYVEWPDSCMRRMRSQDMINPEASNREIMVGSLCGQVYFIDYLTGKASRKPINVDNPIKGTMSLDPTLNGNLYVGQGVPDNRPFGALTINLFENKIVHFFPEDPNARRHWGAYDSSPVRVGQFLFRPGENGTLYKWYIGADGLKLQSTLRYSVNGAAPGMEASMAVYANYGYTGDNHGNILCVNLDTMKPVWCYSLGDDIDSSIVLIEEDGVPYIYTGCEIDRQKQGSGKYVKIDGRNGELCWKLEVPGCQRIIGEKHFDGGFYSTGLPGVGNCSSLMFINCVLNTSGSNGEFLAIDRATGNIVYRVPTKVYAWSSPVGFVNERNEMYVVTGDCNGNIYLIKGIDGEIIFLQHVGNNFESSPVVVDDCFVVGSRGETIYKMQICGLTDDKDTNPEN